MSTAMDWFVYCLRRYVTFKGRASRPEFWWFYLVVLIGIAATYALRLIAPVVAPTIQDAWNLLLALPHTAVTTRRLHDVGRSFWWVAAVLIDVALLVVFELSNVSDSLVMGILGLLASIVFFVLLIILLYFLTMPGDSKPNRYGDVPSHTP
jgi:uncharacterized membrane protein YhaH (DUF805 family)